VERELHSASLLEVEKAAGEDPGADPASAGGTSVPGAAVAQGVAEKDVAQQDVAGPGVGETNARGAAGDNNVHSSTK